MPSIPKSLALVGVGLIVPSLAARAARKAVGAGYQAITNNDPPENPAHPEVAWREAVIWTMSTAIVGGLARLAVRRWMADTDIPAEGYDMDGAV